MSHLQDLLYLQQMLRDKKLDLQSQIPVNESELQCVDRLILINNGEVQEYSRLENTDQSVDATNDTQHFRHDSYGLLTMTHTTGGSGNLFGCSVRHDQQISITLNRGEYCRSLGHDQYHTTSELFNIRMSKEQFGQFVCSVGQGSGVPVTISRIGRRLVKSPPFINKVTMVKDQFRVEMKKIGKLITNVNASISGTLLAKGPISVTQRSEIASTLRTLIQEIESNLPFIVDCYDETTHKILSEAKIAFDALVRNSNNITHDRLPQLTQFDDKSVD